MPCGFKIPFGRHRVDRINLANAVKQSFIVKPHAHIGILVHLRSHGTWGESQVAMLRTVWSAAGSLELSPFGSDAVVK